MLLSRLLLSCRAMSSSGAFVPGWTVVILIPGGGPIGKGKEISPLLLGKAHLLTRSWPSGTPSGRAAKTTDEPAARPRHRGRRKRLRRARPTRKKSP